LIPAKYISTRRICSAYQRGKNVICGRFYSTFRRIQRELSIRAFLPATQYPSRLSFNVEALRESGGCKQSF